MAVGTALGKGNSLIGLFDDYVAVDLETTGLNPRFDEIIEIGAIRISHGKRVATYNTLVKPFSPICRFITQLTGISNEMVADAPTICEILPTFSEFVGESVLIGHNVNFDINFLCENMKATDYRLPNDFVDTLRLSRKLFKSYENHRLCTLAKNMNIINVNEHRALADCEVAYKIYEYIKDYVAKNNISLF